MLNKNDQAEAVRRFCTAVGNLSKELLDGGGATHAALAAGLRIEAGKVEMAGERAPLALDELEMVDLVRKAHEFINALIVVGIDEAVAVAALGHSLIERVARTRGAAGAAHWLRAQANLVDANGDSFEQTSQAH